MYVSNDFNLFIALILNKFNYILQRTPLLKYFSSFLLMLMTTILPSLVMLAQSQIPFRTKSAFNHSMMFKVYIFLVFMVLILPSLGLMT